MMKYLKCNLHQTFGANYTLDIANDEISANASISHNLSQNDYDYIGYDKKNENGQYENTSFNSHIGYRLNQNNEIFKNIYRIY